MTFIPPISEILYCWDATRGECRNAFCHPSKNIRVLWLLFDLFNKTKLFVISVSGFTITCSLSFHFIKPHPPFWCPILLGPFLILCFSIDLPTVNLLSRPNTIYSRYIAQQECSRRTERVLVYSKMNHPLSLSNYPKTHPQSKLQNDRHTRIV